MQENKCTNCEKHASIGIVLREWYWVSHNRDGYWFCSKTCLRNYIMEPDNLKRWTPTPEEEERMRE